MLRQTLFSISGSAVQRTRISFRFLFSLRGDAGDSKFFSVFCPFDGDRRGGSGAPPRPSGLRGTLLLSLSHLWTGGEAVYAAAQIARWAMRGSSSRAV